MYRSDCLADGAVNPAQPGSLLMEQRHLDRASWDEHRFAHRDTEVATDKLSGLLCKRHLTHQEGQPCRFQSVGTPIYA